MNWERCPDPGLKPAKPVVPLVTFTISQRGSCALVLNAEAVLASGLRTDDYVMMERQGTSYRIRRCAAKDSHGRMRTHQVKNWLVFNTGGTILKREGERPGRTTARCMDGAVIFDAAKLTPMEPGK